MVEPGSSRPTRVRVEVRVELKPEVQDAEGESVQRSLGLLGVSGVDRVRVARVFELEFDTADATEAERRAHEAVDRLLANPVIHRVTVRTSGE